MCNLLVQLYIYIYQDPEAMDVCVKGDDQKALDPEAQKVASSQAELEGTGLEGTKLDEGTKPAELWPNLLYVFACIPGLYMYVYIYIYVCIASWCS